MFSLYLVRKKGPYGEFYGCSNYPDCRHKLKVEIVKIKLRTLKTLLLYNTLSNCIKL
ncbi:topoisomerase DNA-binding C4 zinc finger domain-containing protein [Neobacillus sp. NPDC093182]|uniref:topoisomerase DNA-binding C4 zinc finger domain-containing protein n=1 Tax=Neobacillus sp. NPDC093182 TaxID=3364297 RepID=UPI00380EA8A9